MRAWLLSFLLCTLVAACQRQLPPAAGIDPPPAGSFLGRRLQARLPQQKADVAVIFIGGFSEQVLLHFRSLYETMPPLPCEGRQLRACYAWDGARGCLVSHNTRLIQRDLRSFLSLNPRADLVFIGHSYGASAIMDVVRRLETPHGRILAVTLDPVSRRARSRPCQRAQGVDYWINVYCSPYRHPKDIAAWVGGAWRECPQADVNIAFSGCERDRLNRRYQHAQPLPLFEDRSPAHGASAYELLANACRLYKLGHDSASCHNETICHDRALDTPSRKR